MMGRYYGIIENCLFDGGTQFCVTAQTFLQWQVVMFFYRELSSQCGHNSVLLHRPIFCHQWTAAGCFSSISLDIIWTCHCRETQSKFAFTRQCSALLEKISVCINHQEPVLLVGETGTGKTSVIQYLAAQTGVCSFLFTFFLVCYFTTNGVKDLSKQYFHQYTRTLIIYA